VDNLTLVRLELDQAGEAASDRLELRRFDGLQRNLLMKVA
jgi:hypothetical protein